jgi:hypothetical protein
LVRGKRCRKEEREERRGEASEGEGRRHKGR